MKNELTVIETGTSVQLGTLNAANPKALIAGATEMADSLAGVIKKQNLFVSLKGKNYVKVEGWTTLAVMLGIVPREVSTVEENGVFTATIELVRISDQAVIGRASAECGEESPWNTRPRYARRSMAQTRATGKACRLAFSWIMSLAGYEATPAEEMPYEQQTSSGRSYSNPPHTGRVVEMQKPTEQEELAVDEKTVRRIESTIGELGINIDGVNEYIRRKEGVASFRDLSMTQALTLIRQLPRMAAAKLIKSVPLMTGEELEAHGMEPPIWMLEGETARLMLAITDELKARAAVVATETSKAVADVSNDDTLSL